MKLSVIGIGSVGSAVATAIANTGLAREMVLFDRDAIRARAAAEDLGHASAFGYDIKITAAANYREIRGSEIVIIAAGANQKPDQTRRDLVSANAAVIRDIMPRVMKNVDAARVKIIVITNPLDPMVMLATKLSGLPAGRVIGTGTMLDSARFKIILSRLLSVSPHSVNAYVLGEHGDSSVLNWSAATIGSIRIDDFCKQVKNPITANARKTIERRVRTAAYDIVAGRGATWDGIAAAAADLVRCIANDEKRILTVSVVQKNLAISRPATVGANGVSAILMPELSAAERLALRKSGDIIAKNFKAI